MFKYKIIPNFLTKEECLNIIDISLNKLILIPAKVGKENTLGVNENYRKSNVAFTNYSESFPSLQERITNTLYLHMCEITNRLTDLIVF